MEDLYKMSTKAYDVHTLYSGYLSHLTTLQVGIVQVYGHETEVYETLQREHNGGLKLARSQVSLHANEVILEKRRFIFVKNVPRELLVPSVRRLIEPVHRLAFRTHTHTHRTNTVTLRRMRAEG